jgi:hypothetical protein
MSPRHKTMNSPHRYRKLSLCIALMLTLLAGRILVGSEQAERNWTNLFESDALPKCWETTGNWHIDGEQIATLTPRPGEHGWKRFSAYLWSKKQYTNFEAEFDYQLEREGNSGFFLHVGDKVSPVEHGIEVQIYDTTEQRASELTDHDAGGVIPGFHATKNAAHPAGEWNHYHITVNGDRLKVELNGQSVNDVDLNSDVLNTRPRKGYIGFQDEGRPLKLRNLRVRELN